MLNFRTLSSDQGGFARCYEVVDPEGNRFAAKTVKKESLRITKNRDKLLAEIKIHRSMNHKNIVKFYKCFEDSVNVYMLLELCEKTVRENQRKPVRIPSHNNHLGQCQELDPAPPKYKPRRKAADLRNYPPPVLHRGTHTHINTIFSTARGTSISAAACRPSITSVESNFATYIYSYGYDLDSGRRSADAGHDGAGSETAGTAADANWYVIMGRYDFGDSF
ncbi:hypothetical protein BC937DRAFT_94405 [Endogone sp. FLAS-F59071]|nr:hypothetical protein BC937DRAFT_94405 [Endogone sp. FLAS-F59071]|eukprot:RUS14064.1 hypothetical protein BC937DRAFT_94405 [Endogone sp. FLAS-F59071]